jgi:hypothetical protein
MGDRRWPVRSRPDDVVPFVDPPQEHVAEVDRPDHGGHVAIRKHGVAADLEAAVAKRARQADADMAAWPQIVNDARETKSIER